MAIETELKLSISPEHLRRLRRHPLLKTLSIGRAATRKLYSVYYDTPDLALHRGGMAVRLRRVGRRWLQTIKGGGVVQAGLHQRNEWETAAAGKELDFDALKACGAPEISPSLRRKLQPVIVTEFSRNAVMLQFEGTEIELSLDSGEIRAGKRTRPISELELELKSGSPQKLFNLAQALLDITPLEVEHTSKSEYGYQLHCGSQPAPLRASFPSLAKTQSIGSALHDMVASCLLHVQANVPGAIGKLGEEYLHQVRVGMRRLRVVLAMAESFSADAELGALHRQVAAICIELGRLREWDVFVTQTLGPVRARLPDHSGLRTLFNVSEKQRALHHADVVRTLQSPDYQRFQLRFGAWMCGDYWRERPAADGPGLADFAVQILDKRSRQVNKRGRQVDGPPLKQTSRRSPRASAAELHALRIACKKLRYSAEMFGSLFAADKTRRYVASLSALQDILGTLNDIAVARRLIDGLESRLPHDTLELIRGWMEHEHAEKISELGKVWKRFARQRAFWG